MTLALAATADAAWNAAHSRLDFLQSAPGLLAFLAIGLAALVARQHLEVNRQELVISNSPRLSRRIPLRTVERVQARPHPPSLWRPNWPFSRTLNYSLPFDRHAGIELTLTSGHVLFIGSISPTELIHAISYAAPHVVTADA